MNLRRQLKGNIFQGAAGGDGGKGGESANMQA